MLISTLSPPSVNDNDNDEDNHLGRPHFLIFRSPAPQAQIHGIAKPSSHVQAGLRPEQAPAKSNAILVV